MIIRKRNVTCTDITERTKKPHRVSRIIKWAAISAVAASLVFFVVFFGFNPWCLYKIKGFFTAHEDIKISLIFNESSKYTPKLVYDEGCSVETGDYRNVKYALYSYEMTDEQVEKVASHWLDGYKKYKEVTDRSVESGDRIDAELYIRLSDGRIFTYNTPYSETAYPDGTVVASASNYASFIAGTDKFADGVLEPACIGHKIGDSVTVNLTLSKNNIDGYNFLVFCGLDDDYNNGLLEGMNIEFTAVIKKISALDFNGYNEDFFNENHIDIGGKTAKNYNEFLTYTRERLEKNFNDSMMRDNSESMMRAIFEVCTFNIPESVMSESWDVWREFILKRQLVIKKIAQAEEFSVTDAEYRAFLKEKYYSITEKYRDRYPTISSIEKEYGEENIKWCMMQEKVMEYLKATLVPYDAGTLDYVKDYLE